MRCKAGLFSRYVPFSPTSITGITGWWDASDSASLFDSTTGGSTVAADGSIARWEDKSGSGRHWTQSTSGWRPIRKTAIRNGIDVVRFDGTQTRMGSSSFNITDIISNSASTVFVVAVASTITGDNATTYLRQVVLTNLGGEVGFVTFRSSGVAGSFGSDSGYKEATRTYSQGAWATFTTMHQSGQLSFRINGASPGTASLGSIVYYGGTGPVLGANVFADRFLNGDIGEIITYNVALSASDREAVESYLMSKWAIT